MTADQVNTFYKSRHLLKSTQPMVRKYCMRYDKLLRSTVKLAFADYQPSTKSNANGPPVLVLHGLFGSKNNWQVFCRRLNVDLNLRVVALDLRNHGESPHSPNMDYSLMAEDIKYFLSSLNIDKAHFLAHSMGGRVAMRLAVQKPECMESLIVEDVLPNNGPPNAHKYLEYMKAMKELDMNFNRKNFASFRQHAMKELKFKIPDIRIRAFLVQNLVKHTSGDVAKWRCNLDAIYNNWCNLSKINKPDCSGKSQFTGPTCFIGGANSPYLPEGRYTDEERAMISKYFPNVEYHVIPEAGHWLHSEQPELFLATVCTFIRTLR